MHLQNIESLIGKLSLNEIEKYLELLVDQINDIDKKVFQEKNQDRKNGLLTLLDSKHSLYEILFEKCRELCKHSGAPAPRYFGKMTIEQLDLEFSRNLALNEYSRKKNDDSASA